MLELNMLLFLKKHLLLLSLFFIVLLNFISLILFPDPLFTLKNKLFSLSPGESYFARLSLIDYFSRSADWDLVENLSRQTFPQDTAYIYSQTHPDQIKKKLNYLTYLSNKTADDYVSIAKIYFHFNQVDKSLANLQKALETDPVRQDIQTLYYQFQKELN